MPCDCAIRVPVHHFCSECRREYDRIFHTAWKGLVVGNNLHRAKLNRASAKMRALRTLRALTGERSPAQSSIGSQCLHGSMNPAGPLDLMAAREAAARLARSRPSAAVVAPLGQPPGGEP